MQAKIQQTYRVQHELGRRGHYEGSLVLSEMDRLCDLVIKDDPSSEQTPIQVSFEFYLNELKMASIKGHISTNLSVECQRCLEPMLYAIDQDFELLIDATEEEIASYKMDTVYSEDGTLDIIEVVEDELILSLPIILMHEDTNCNELWQAETDEAVSERPNPFAVLQALKGNKD